MTMPYQLERAIHIEAPVDTVFRYFTDSARWAAWWGQGSSIDARPGGTVKIVHPNGVEAGGEVVDIEEGAHIAFTFGYASGQPMAIGASVVTIRVRAQGKGTEVNLTHVFAAEAERDLHVQGWRYQLSLFGNTVANEVHANAVEMVDGWFAVWNMADKAKRDAALEKVVSPGVTFRDRNSLLDGTADLSAHISAALRFMPGITLARKGRVRQCQGTALADWGAVTADGTERMTGTSVFRLGADGRIDGVVGITNT
jgi:uncharacterized protein YndB with AHSA1/START domain